MRRSIAQKNYTNPFQLIHFNYSAINRDSIVYKLHIQNETVRMNIALIVETVRHLSDKQRQKKLDFALDLKTGMLSLLTASLSESKAIQIDLDLDEKQVHIISGGEPFNMDEMDSKGRQVFSETCNYLTAAMKELREIHEFAHIEFEPSIQEIVQRDLLQDAWHAVERQEAELMLLNTSPGTYLFRKDRFAGVMEEIISSAKKSRIRCFTLSYLDPTKQVREKTIVSWKNHWLFYDDDPTLSGNYFENLEHLLSSMGTALQRPLPALRSRRTA